MKTLSPSFLQEQTIVNLDGVTATVTVHVKMCCLLSRAGGVVPSGVVGVVGVGVAGVAAMSISGWLCSRTRNIKMYTCSMLLLLELTQNVEDLMRNYM